MKNILCIFLLCLFASCSFFKKKQQIDKDVIARVNEEYLYASDLESLTKGLSGADSVEALKTYAQSWIRKKLLLLKATENIAADDLSITKKIEDYRESLLLYEYEKALIYQKLDTVVKQQELLDKYEKMKADFLLDEDVYQLFFVKIKKDAPDLDKARKWILKPKDEDDFKRLQGYAKDFASMAVLEKGMWYTKPDILKAFPLNENDLSLLYNAQNFKEFKTDEGAWFIRVAGRFKQGEPAPLQFVSDKIVKAIVEKRRLQLVERVYAKVEQDGVKSKSVEVFVK